MTLWPTAFSTTFYFSLIIILKKKKKKKKKKKELFLPQFGLITNIAPIWEII